MIFPLPAVLLAALGGLVLATLVGGWAARRGFPMPVETRRLGTIDGLRGYLALLVMVHHFATYLLLAVAGGGWRDAPVTLLQSFGAGSVALFFMITGALFFPKTWHGIRGNDWRAMYVNRGFRILPLQVVTVTLIALIALFRVDFAVGATWTGFPARFLVWLTSWRQPALFGYRGSAQINAFVFWSLWAEWKFYFLALPLIALAMTVLGARRGRWLVPLAMLAAGLAFRWSGSPALTTANYSLFACGMLALLVRTAPWSAALRGAPAALIAGVAVALAAALSPVPDAPLPLAAYTLFFACVLRGNGFLGLLTSRGALVLGEASFSIYMLHGVLLNIVFVDGAGAIAMLPLAVRPWLLVGLMPVMAGLAIVAYRYVERPMIAVGRRLAKRWGAAAQTRAEVSATVAAP